MYFVTTITNLIPEDVPFSDERWKKHSARCVGYYPDLDMAMTRVKQNVCDLHETIYDYAVIEQIDPGIYQQPNEEYWFCFNVQTGQYDPIEKPVETNHLLNWAIG